MRLRAGKTKQPHFSSKIFPHAIRVIIIWIFMCECARTVYTANFECTILGLETVNEKYSLSPYMILYLTYFIKIGLVFQAFDCKTLWYTLSSILSTYTFFLKPKNLAHFCSGTLHGFPNFEFYAAFTNKMWINSCPYD